MCAKSLCDPMDYSPPGSSVHRNSPGKNIEMGCHALLQGIFLTQGLNPCLLYFLHFRWILYHWATWVGEGGGIKTLLCLTHSVVFDGSSMDKAMAPHSSTLAWKIPWTEEPGGLQSMGSWRVRHDWTTSLWLFSFMHWRRKWQPTPVFLPRESQGRGSLVGCHLWGWTRLKWLSSSSSVTFKSKSKVF